MEKLHKNLSAIIKNVGKTRHILGSINFNENGNLYVTDSYIAVEIIGGNLIEKTFNLNPETLSEVAGNYPNVERLIRNESENEFELSVSDVATIVKVLKPNKKDDVELVFGDGNLLITAQSSKISANLTNKGINFEKRLFVSADLLLKVLNFPYDNKQPVSVGINKPAEAIVFKGQKEDYRIILMPIRKE